MKRIIAALYFSALCVVAQACKGASKHDCSASTRGYNCMKQLSDYYYMHWTLNGPFLSLGLEGIGAEWVGYSFPERPGVMDPADSVVGFIDVNGPDINPYRIIEKSIFREDIDIGIRLLNASAEQDDRGTFVSFIRDLRQGAVRINPIDAVDVNYAIGAVDDLKYHGLNRGSATVCFAARSADGNQDIPPPPSPSPSPSETPDAAAEPVAPPTPANPAQSTGRKIGVILEAEAEASLIPETEPDMEDDEAVVDDLEQLG